MANNQTTVVYLARDLNDLAALQSSCNFYEARNNRKVVNIELAAMESDDGDKAVAVTYEDVDPFTSGVNLGQLSLEAYKNSAEANLIRSEFLLEQATPVLPGDAPDPDTSVAKAFIKDETVKFVIFRDKAA